MVSGREQSVTAMSRAHLSVLVIFMFVILSMPTFALIPGDAVFELTDFPNYYAASNLIWSGHGADIYKHDLVIKREDELFPRVPKGRDLPVLVPPFSLPLLLPLVLLPPEPARLTWAVAQIFAVVFSLLLCAKLFQISERRLLFLTITVGLSGPFWESMRCAQIAPFLLLSLCFTITCLQRKSQFLAGIASGVFLFKPHECFHQVLSQFAALQWRYIFSLGGIFLLASIISFAAVGIDGWSAWRHLMSALLVDPQGTGPQLNPTIRGQLLRIGAMPGAFVLMVSTVCWFVFSAFALWLGFKKKANLLFPEIVLAITLPCSLLTSFHSHNYDLMLLLPGTLALNKIGETTLVSAVQRKLLKGLIVLLILPLLLPFYIIIHYGLLVHGFVFNPFFFSVLLLLFTALFLVLRTGPDENQSQEDGRAQPQISSP